MSCGEMHASVGARVCVCVFLPFWLEKQEEKERKAGDSLTTLNSPATGDRARQGPRGSGAWCSALAGTAAPSRQGQRPVPISLSLAHFCIPIPGGCASLKDAPGF